MKSKGLKKKQLRFEQLEGRRVLSASSVLHAAGIQASVIQSQSTNWSGYALTTSPGAVSTVSGSWTVPTVTASTRKGTDYSAVWVGIDGFNSSTVEQIGTEQDASANGATSYYAWYEMYPAGSVNITSTNYRTGVTTDPVKPGDAVTASVAYTGTNQFTLTINDTTQGWSYSTVQQMGSSGRHGGGSQAQRSSAEWVVEAPSMGGILPLANFGTVTFTGAAATISGSSQANLINMITNSGAPLDTASVNSSGTQITVQYGTSNSSSSSGSSSSSSGSTGTTTTSTPPPPSGQSGWGSGWGGWGWGGWGWFSARQTSPSAQAQNSSQPTSFDLDIRDRLFASLGTYGLSNPWA